MEKLTKQQLDGICELLHHTHNEEMTQYILNTIGKENWTRDVLSECGGLMTVEQEDLFATITIKKNPNRREDEEIGEIDEYN